ncbi:MAG TPA: hypothetical protein VHE13_10610 [Opitutus sp.]|nr:hypothetical protein [Opitutus sp.]
MRTPFAVRAILWLWFFAAVAVGQLATLQRLPRPAVPGLVIAITAALVLAYRRLPPLRAWVDAIDVRALVLLHVTRFVGLYFLILYDRGELPYAFAVPAGIGDIVVAALALAVVFVPLGDATPLRAITIWNVLGLTDILLVVFSAARIALAGGDGLLPLTQLPLSLLPTFLVPLIIATHLAIFARLAPAPAA